MRVITPLFPNAEINLSPTLRSSKGTSLSFCMLPCMVRHILFSMFSSLKIEKRMWRTMQGNIQKLNEVPFEDLRVGDRLISAFGKRGVITRIDPHGDGWIEMT